MQSRCVEASGGKRLRYGAYRNNRVLLAILVLSLLLLLTPLQADDTIESDDGQIYVRGHIENNLVHFDWRFRNVDQVSSVNAGLNGNPLPVTNRLTYPQPGDTTGLLFLLDVSDPAREPIIQKQVLALVELLPKAKQHQHVALAEFAANFELVAPFSNSPNTLIGSLAKFRAHGKTTELYRSVIDAIDFLAKSSHKRRELILFSDGQAEDQAYTLEEVVLKAKSSGVVIHALGYPAKGQRATALQNIRKLAEHTGGKFHAASLPEYLLPVAFLANPFPASDTGGSMTVDMGDPFYFPGEPQSGMLSIEFKHSNGLVTVTSEIEFRPAGREEWEALLLSDRYRYWTYAGIGICVLVVLLIALKILVVIRRLLPSREEVDVPPEPLAFIDILDSTERQHAIISTSTKIGRNHDNEIVLNNSSISGTHASIIQKRDGSFFIKDLNSVNKIYVNGKTVEESILKDGDTFELGDVRLRFHSAKPS